VSKQVAATRLMLKLIDVIVPGASLFKRRLAWP
jgi:hypothetical protein